MVFLLPPGESQRDTGFSGHRVHDGDHFRHPDGLRHGEVAALRFVGSSKHLPSCRHGHSPAPTCRLTPLAAAGGTPGFGTQVREASAIHQRTEWKLLGFSGIRGSSMRHSPGMQ